jgi:hypothetical protein
MPVAGATVVLRTNAADEGTVGLYQQSDADGRFSFSNLGRGSAYDLIVYHIAHSVGQFSNINYETHGTEEVPFTLPEGIRVRGVLNGTGETQVPVGSLIRLRITPDEVLSDMTLYAFTTAGGEFEFPPVPPSRCRVVVLSEGYVPLFDNFRAVAGSLEIFRSLTLEVASSDPR